MAELPIKKTELFTRLIRLERNNTYNDFIIRQTLLMINNLNCLNAVISNKKLDETGVIYIYYAKIKEVLNTTFYLLDPSPDLINQFYFFLKVNKHSIILNNKEYLLINFDDYMTYYVL